MKRSEINDIMRAADAFFRSQGFYLPPFAYWSPQEWKKKGDEVTEIVDRRLGWDITDFGRGKFCKCGLAIFTIRNGTFADLPTGKGKLYAEKILMFKHDQVCPFHFHWHKMEDIINRGGGELYVQVYNSESRGRRRRDAGDAEQGRHSGPCSMPARRSACSPARASACRRPSTTSSGAGGTT